MVIFINDRRLNYLLNIESQYILKKKFCNNITGEMFLLQPCYVVFHITVLQYFDICSLI